MIIAVAEADHHVRVSVFLQLTPGSMFICWIMEEHSLKLLQSCQNYPRFLTLLALKLAFIRCSFQTFLPEVASCNNDNNNNNSYSNSTDDDASVRIM